MTFDVGAIINLVGALAQFIPGVVTPAHVTGALVGAGVLTQAEADANADLQALIAEALAAKAEADAAAAGNDPQ
jgi:hypothetical protein